MKVSLALSWRWSLALFVVLAGVLRVSVVTAALICVVVPASQVDVHINWKSVLAAAVVVGVAKRAEDDYFACMGGKFLRDFSRSRLGSLAYQLLGGLIHFAEEAAPLREVPRVLPRVVQVIRTAKGTGERLASLTPLVLAAAMPPPLAPSLLLAPEVRYQEFLGFGGSFTESSADLLLQMSPDKQDLIIDAFFHAEKGLGFKFGRLHMGSCDFSRGNWSCLEEPDDVELRSFSIQRYEHSILPMIRRAQVAAGGHLKLVASPWSPPRWMKDHDSMLQGGKLRPEYRGAWARHYVRFAEEFKAAGVPLWAFTVQNEPQAATPWENCLYTHEEERDFVRDYLGPALNSSGLGLKLLVWDHNRDDMFARAKAIYSDPEAEKYVWGLGYHWYGDPRHEIWPAREGQVLFDNVRRVHELRPDKHIIMTEACQEFGPRIGDWAVAERYGEAIIRDLNNWLEAWIDWNLILDPRGGPNHVQNFVTSPVIADPGRGRVLFLSTFYYMAHFSRYIKPGARRIAAASNRDALEATAFENPDGTLAAVVMNQGAYDIAFWLRVGALAAEAQAPAHSITTFLLPAPEQ